MLQVQRAREQGYRGSVRFEQRTRTGGRRPEDAAGLGLGLGIRVTYRRDERLARSPRHSAIESIACSKPAGEIQLSRPSSWHEEAAGGSQVHGRATFDSLGRPLPPPIGVRTRSGRFVGTFCHVRTIRQLGTITTFCTFCTWWTRATKTLGQVGLR